MRVEGVKVCGEEGEQEVDSQGPGGGVNWVLGVGRRKGAEQGYEGIY